MSGERGPIVIGGLAHSGKTQLRVVLGAHPGLSMTRRTYMWDRFYGCFGDLSGRRNLDRCLAALVADKDVRRLGPDPNRIRDDFLEGPSTYARLFALVHEHHAQRMGKRRWGDQLGFVERFVDLILAAFPSARIIHMIRDPRGGHETDSSMVRGKRGRLGWETAKWLCSADLAEHNRRHYPDNYRVVRYETFAARPEQTVRELCGFILEEYVPEMHRALSTLSFDSHEFHEATFQRRASPDMAFIDMYARQRMLAFDYPATRGSLSLRDRSSFWLADWPLNRAGMVAWRVLKGRRSAKRVRG
jgi:hypothetical protein